MIIYPRDGKIWFSNAVTIVGFLIILCGFVVLGYQGLLWFRYGYWTPIELWMIWLKLNGSPVISDLAVWVLDMPLAGALVLVGIGTAWLGAYMAEEARYRRRIEQNRYRAD